MDAIKHGPYHCLFLVSTASKSLSKLLSSGHCSRELLVNDTPTALRQFLSVEDHDPLKTTKATATLEDFSLIHGIYLVNLRH